MHCTLANLESDSLNQLKSLEQKTGKVVLAYACQKTKPAVLTADEIAELQALESKLGMTLVALEA